jgi:hypothetical protein
LPALWANHLLACWRTYPDHIVSRQRPPDPLQLGTTFAAFSTFINTRGLMRIWYKCRYLFEFVSGLFLANGVPHFVEGISSRRFQSPFGYPPGVGKSSPLSNTLWGFTNLMVGFILLGFFAPEGSAGGWILVALGVLLAAIWLSTYFGRLRWRQARKLSQRQRGFDPLSPS